MLPTMAVAKNVLEQALELNEEERCDLISELMGSLEDERDEASKLSSDAEWQAAWKETIERRLRSIDDGTVELIDGDEVLAEMHALAAAPLP